MISFCFFPTVPGDPTRWHSRHNWHLLESGLTLLHTLPVTHLWPFAKGKYFLLALDESTDLKDTAPLLIFIREINDNFDHEIPKMENKRTGLVKQCVWCYREVVAMQKKKITINLSWCHVPCPKTPWPGWVLCFSKWILKMVQRMLVLFGSNYVCEQTFSVMNINKPRHRAHLTDEHLRPVLGIPTTKLTPNFNVLAKKGVQQHCSHWNWNWKFLYLLSCVFNN